MHYINLTINVSIELLVSLSKSYFWLLLENVEILANHEWSCWGELCSLSQWYSVAFPCWEGRINKAKKKKKPFLWYLIMMTKTVFIYSHPSIEPQKQQKKDMKILLYKNLKFWKDDVLNLQFIGQWLRNTTYVWREICKSVSYKI